MVKEVVERITLHIHIDKADGVLNQLFNTGYRTVEGCITSWTHSSIGSRPVSYRIVAEKVLEHSVVDERLAQEYLF